ncbi:hypothetical protein [Sessilibacter corallicola]|uniref:hypothetical protein n=1 Tax=Sessilibacter corallicola TaxID=2904075 RepID=UPI001E593ABC|nr:hypothetical protein [Sessilibacter corallicola]MCE2027422.1 hypothetical protein [Sessilibacter corallicola]
MLTGSGHSQEWSAIATVAGQCLTLYWRINMKYVWGVLLPALAQIVVTWIVITVNTGNGSWLGLGAFVLAIFAVPTTAIANFVSVRTHAEGDSIINLMTKCLLITAITPVLLVFLIALS